jgi:hypothetical protein|tara:strand:- start:1422 stop:1769 length:348 start_codon:yes stop_codon:yes gene_type:complete
MRVIATFILFFVAMMAQAVAPVVTHVHEASSNATAAAQHVSQENAAQADHGGHNGGAEFAPHCTASGHCPSSAINAESMLYGRLFARATKIAGRIRDDAAPGFAFPPYRPPSPLS